MNVVVAGKILQSGEGLTFFNKDNSANFSGEKKSNEAFRVFIFRAGKYANKTLSKISSSNTKVSNLLFSGEK